MGDVLTPQRTQITVERFQKMVTTGVITPPGSHRALPTAGDLLLLVEVADSTLAFDRAKKLPLYAKQGIPEYWIVNLPDKRLEVYREPGPAGYAAAVAVTAGQYATLALLPHVEVSVAQVLG